ncbi:MAG: hypothetical protein ACXQTP_05960 [Candidatus Methanofastidiosia archaeon]
MKNKNTVIITILLIVFSAVPAVTADEEYDLPTVTIEMPASATPGMEIAIKVKVENTTGTKMWHSRVFIDTAAIPTNIKQYLEFYETEKYLTKYKQDQGLEDSMETGEEANAVFRIKVLREAPAMNMPITIVLETEIGLCEAGCSPYRQSVPNTTKIIRNEPNLSLDLEINEFTIQVGDCYVGGGDITIPYTITNTSQTTAYNINLNVVGTKLTFSQTITPQMPITSLGGEDDKSGNIYITIGTVGPGQHTLTAQLTYEDHYGKHYLLEKTFQVTILANAYALYNQAEIYFESCNYENAKEYYQSAKDAYEVSNNMEMAEKCRTKIELITANEYFANAQDYFFSGDYETASLFYKQAKTHYENANNCTGIKLCENGIDACESPATQNNGSSSGAASAAGGLSWLNVFFIIVIMGLVGTIFLIKRR